MRIELIVVGISVGILTGILSPSEWSSLKRTVVAGLITTILLVVMGGFS